MSFPLENAGVVSRFSRLMESLNRFKSNGFLCDFRIKVGSKYLHVHRNILAASSQYFEAMFSSNMKEVRQGFIHMEDVEPTAIEFCIGFMYTGEANLTTENIQDVLHASNILQLGDLKNICFQDLKKHLSPQTCLFAINLALIYERSDVVEEAEHIVMTNFDAVISSDNFQSLTRQDLVRYIQASDAGYQISWKAATIWTRGQNKNLNNVFWELTSAIGIEDFPIKFIFEAVLKDPLVMDNEKVRASVIADLFINVQKLEDFLDVENSFVLKNLAQSTQLVNITAVDNTINQFLANNLKKVIEKKEFIDLRKDDMLAMFKSIKSKTSTETLKWNAALSWVRNDKESRKNIFPKLFSMINLFNIPLNFLKETVRSESLVKESQECNDMLFEAIYSIASRAEISNFINEQPSNGTMTHTVVSRSIPGFKPFRTLTITYIFPAGLLEKIAYSSEVFTAYLPGAIEGWQLCGLLRKAFDDGLTFKLELIGVEQAKIVWNDIPHKTSPTGGLDINGYPDKKFLRELYKILKSKGYRDEWLDRWSF